MALSTPNVSDALDKLQISGAPQGIQALYECAKIVGPATTLKLVPVSAAKQSAVEGTLEAIKLGDPGAVLVIDCSENPLVNCYGGIGGYTTKHFGLVGCVADGVMRDIDEYKSYGLPVYGKGIVQQSIRGRSACAGYGIEARISGVPVRPGDMMMADDSGVVVVPRERITEVLEYAQIVKATEDKVIADIRAGMDPIEAHQRAKYDNMLKPTRS
jgi:4-hydroxy-4-methyl-2-oxoglutarate aldolase